jgi:hypothetical protein
MLTLDSSLIEFFLSAIGENYSDKLRSFYNEQIYGLIDKPNLAPSSYYDFLLVSGDTARKVG